MNIEAVRRAPLADSSFESAYILLDFGKPRDALLCLRRAVTLKVQAFVEARTGQCPEEAALWASFEPLAQGTPLADPALLDAIRRVGAGADRAPDEELVAAEELQRLFLSVRKFFRLCNGAPAPAPRWRWLGLPRFSVKQRSAGGATLLAALGILGWSRLPARRKAPQGVDQPIEWTVVHGTISTSGLWGTYLKTTDPIRDHRAKILASRADPFIAFDWSSIPPGPRLPSTNYSVVWTGRVLADKTGAYRFITLSDDGARLWIDGRLLIDDWNLHGVEERHVDLTLNRGWHAIRLDYLQLGGNAVVRLKWRPPGGREVTIPSNHLSPNDA